jgi:hypothetical protein
MTAIAIINANPSELSKKINALLAKSDMAKKITCSAISHDGEVITVVISDDSTKSVNTPGTIHQVSLLSGSASKIEKAIQAAKDENPYVRIDSILVHNPPAFVELTSESTEAPAAEGAKNAAKKAAKKVAKKTAGKSKQEPVIHALLVTVQP